MARSKLKAFWEDNRQAEKPLEEWYERTEKATWTKPADLQETFGSADFVGDRVVFNIGGNNYRLICWVRYPKTVKGKSYSGMVYVKWIGTHAEYDKINVEAV